MLNCPKGKILRKGYLRKTKTKSIKVKAKCIRSTSASGQKRTTRDLKIMASKNKMHRQMREKYGTPKCKKGEIVREGYKRKSYTKKTGTKVGSKNIKPGCIKKVGKPGSKGRQLFRLEKGTLGKYGYENVQNLNKMERRYALNRAVKDMNPLSVYRKLIAVNVLNENKNPSLARLYKDDANYVKTTTDYKHRPTATKL